MDEKIFKATYLDIGEKAFFCLFNLYAILGSCSLTHGRLIISFLMWPTFLLGIFLAGYKAICFREYRKMPFLSVLVCLLASIGISTLVNYRYSFKSNLIFCIYWTFYFLVFYTMGFGCSSEQIKAKFRFAASVYVIGVSLMAVISLAFFAAGYSKTMIDSETGFEYYIGFAIGRLCGVFLNPNPGAISCSVSCALLVYFVHIGKKLWVRISGIIMIVLNLLYIAFSDSRAGAVCLGIITGAFTFFMLLYKFKSKKFWYKILAVLCAAITLTVGYFIPRKIKTIYNIIVSRPIYENSINGNDEEKKDIMLIERGYDLSTDISNKRFDLWKSGLEIYSYSFKNIILGTGFGGIVEYAKANLPKTYLVNNSLKGIRTFENEFFNVLVSQGAVGVVIVLILIVSILRFLYKRFPASEKADVFMLAVMLSCIFGLAVTTMVGAVIFYHFSQIPIIFWTLLGLMVSLLSLNKGVEEKNET